MLASKAAYAGARVGDRVNAATVEEDQGTEDDEDNEDVEEFHDSEDNDDFHDVEDDALDFQAFQVVHPFSTSEVIHVPLFTISVQGIQPEKLRPNDERWLNTIPSDVKEAVLYLGKILDPLDMDVSLPTLSIGILTIISNVFGRFLNSTILRFLRYCKWELQRFRDDLELLRIRDVPGYEERTMVDNIDDDIQSIAEIQLPSCLPSRGNLEKLLLFNRFAKPHGWFATLVRIERQASGSLVLGFRLQLSRLFHQQQDTTSFQRQPSDGFLRVDSSFEQMMAKRENRIARKGQAHRTGIVTHSSTNSFPDTFRDGEKEQEGGRASNLSLSSEQAWSRPTENVIANFLSHFHAGSIDPLSPPLLLYIIEGKPEMPLSIESVISYASTLGYLNLHDLDRK